MATLATSIAEPIQIPDNTPRAPYTFIPAPYDLDGLTSNSILERPIDEAELRVIGHNLLAKRRAECSKVGEKLTDGAMEMESVKAQEKAGLLVKLLTDSGMNADAIYRTLASPTGMDSALSILPPELTPAIRESCAESNRQGNRNRS